MNKGTPASSAPGVSVRGITISETVPTRLYWAGLKNWGFASGFCDAACASNTANNDGPAMAPIASADMFFNHSRRFIASSSQVAALEFFHGVVGRACGQRHVREGRVLTGGRRHRRTVGHEDVLAGVYLVPAVEHRGL